MNNVKRGASNAKHFFERAATNVVNVKARSDMVNKAKDKGITLSEETVTEDGKNISQVTYKFLGVAPITFDRDKPGKPQHCVDKALTGFINGEYETIKGGLLEQGSEYKLLKESASEMVRIDIKPYRPYEYFDPWEELIHNHQSDVTYNTPSGNFPIHKNYNTTTCFEKLYPNLGNGEYNLRYCPIGGNPNGYWEKEHVIKRLDTRLIDALRDVCKECDKGKAGTAVGEPDIQQATNQASKKHQ